MSRLHFFVVTSKLVRLNIVIPDIYNVKMLSSLRENQDWYIHIFCNDSPKAKKYLAGFIKKHTQTTSSSGVTSLAIHGVANILMAIRTMILDTECITPLFGDEKQHLSRYCMILDAIPKDWSAPIVTTDASSSTYVPVKTSGDWPASATSLTMVSTTRRVAAQLTHALPYVDLPSAAYVPSAIAAPGTTDLTTLALPMPNSEKPPCFDDITGELTDTTDLATISSSVSDQETDTTHLDIANSADPTVSVPSPWHDTSQRPRGPRDYLGTQFTRRTINLHRFELLRETLIPGVAYTARDPKIRLFESRVPDPNPSSYSDFIKILRRR